MLMLRLVLVLVLVRWLLASTRLTEQECVTATPTSKHGVTPDEALWHDGCGHGHGHGHGPGPGVGYSCVICDDETLNMNIVRFFVIQLPWGIGLMRVELSLATQMEHLVTAQVHEQTTAYIRHGHMDIWPPLARILGISKMLIGSTLCAFRMYRG